MKVTTISFNKAEQNYLIGLFKKLYADLEDNQQKAVFALLAEKVAKDQSNYSDGELSFMTTAVSGLLKRIEHILATTKEDRVDIRIKAQAVKSAYLDMQTKLSPTNTQGETK